MAILYGYYQADAGTIEVDGQVAQIRNSHEAIAQGIGMVHQHFMLVDTLTALDNVLLGAEPHGYLPKAQAEVRAGLEKLMRETGLRVDLDARVDSLPVGELQRLEILKALYRGAKLLILDEPTAVLTPQETEQLFEVLRGLRARGTTLILITHKLKEVMALSDAITVMRAGKVVHRCKTAETDEAQLAEAMVGRKVVLGRDGSPAHRPDAEPLLAVQGLSLRSAQGVPLLREVALALRPGEIVGVAGVSGNGQTELLEVLSGLARPDAGQMTLGDARFDAAQWLNPKRARALGLGHVPEDRHACGLVMGFPAWESAGLGFQNLPKYRKGLFGLNGKVLKAATAAMMERFDVRPAQCRVGFKQVQRRQSAKADPGARDRREPQGVAGGPAHARRGHRRHRIHSQPAARAARCGLCGAGGVQRTRRDPGPGRPRAGDERRSHHRRAGD